MQKWKQKAIIQKIISYLPFSHNINYIFQKYVTKGVYLTDDYFYDKLGHARNHINAFQKFSTKTVPESSLEIGTGWYPIVPVSLFLIGADKINSVDISALMTKARIKSTLLKFTDCIQAGRLKEYINYDQNRYANILELLAQYDAYSLDEILKKLKITYLIENASKLSIPDNTIDLINSNNTFEHIYPDVLIPILKEFKRIVKKPNGVMSHFIDMSDHFAHFDKSINIYNFLQFTDKEWKWLDNSIQPQNRLRIYDYKEIYDQLDIPISDLSIREGSLNELKSIRLAVKYSNFPAEDIAVSHCHLTSKV